MSNNIQKDVENKIIDCIVLGSGGRLLVTKPEEFKNGADLVIKRNRSLRNWPGRRLERKIENAE